MCQFGTTLGLVHSGDELRADLISPRVNGPRNDEPACIESLV
jgi:hypothetical protein